MLNTFVDPLAVWRPPLPAKNPARPPIPEAAQPDWRDLAAEEQWAEAIVGFLRSDWRKYFRLWTVVNTLVAESRQRSRFDVRNATYECLQELMRLRRERVVFRYKRQWVSILDNGVPVTPLENLPLRPAVGWKRAADSTPSAV